MTKYNKNRTMNRVNVIRNRRRGQRGDVENSQLTVPGVPKPSGGETMRPVYNPGWNPQYLKVARRIMYSVPSADVSSPYIADPSVGCLASNLSFNSGAISFRVSDVYNVSEFGTLFDQYRIAGVKIEFHYITSSEAALTTTASNQQAVSLALYEDYDDSTAPTTTIAGWNSMLETGRARIAVFPSGRRNCLTYTLNPKYLVADIDNAGGTTGRSLADGWLDGATTPEVVWRGLKWSLQANPGNTTIVHSFRVYETFFLCFRQRQ